MTNPLHAPFYADRALQRRVAVLENIKIARDTYRVRFACPEIAARIVPGQFLMLRLPDSNDPLLGRAFALFDTVPNAAGRPWAIDLVYLIVGKFTGNLARWQPGRELDIWGPLGNGFSPEPVEHLVMVAGGIGQTPFAALAQEFLGRRLYGEPPRRLPAGSAELAEVSRRVTFCYGVRSADYFACLDDFERFGVDLRLSTDDGTRGHHGFVTDVLRQVLAESKLPCRVACCGPEPMMEAVAEIAHAAAVPCEVSLETPMACGIGICFSCVTQVRLPEGGWDYKRTCVEGPVFDAARIEW